MAIRILIVDDDRDLLSLIERFLVKEYPDFQTVSAVTAQDALRFLETEEIDAIVCDYYMGPKEMNGLELLEWLKRAGSTLPFIMFTGRSREEVAIRALNLGADFYLKKDIDDFENLFKELAHHIKSTVETRKMEEALRESESRFRAVFEQAPIGVARVDLEGHILEANNSLSYMLGYDIDELLAINVFDITNEEDKQKELRLSQEMLHGLRDNYQMEKRYYRKDGEMIWGRLSVSAVLNSNRQPIFTIGMVEDITDQKKDREALRESEAKFRALFEGAGIGIVAAANDYILDANPAFVDLLGYSREELLQMRVADFSHQNDQEIDKQLLTIALESGTDTYGMLKRYRRKDGIQIFGKLSVSIVRGQKDDSQYMFGIVEDVTDQVNAAKALEQSESRFRSVFEDSPIGIDLFDDAGQLVSANRAMLEMFGVQNLDSLAGFNIFEDPNFPDDAKLKLKNGQSVSFESVFDFAKVKEFNLYETSKTGIKHFDVVAGPFGQNPDGSILGYLVQVTDISSRKNAENALIESEQRYQILVENTFDGIFIHEDYIIQDINQQMADLVGSNRESLIGTNGLEVMIAPEFLDIRTSAESGAKKNLKEAQIKRIDGSTRLVESFGSPCRYNGQEARIVAVRDITERKMYEQALQEERDKAEMYFDSAGAVMVLLDSEGVVQQINQKGCEILGYSLEEIVGKSWIDNFIPERLRGKIQDVFLSLKSNNVEARVEEYDYPILTKKNEERYITWRNRFLVDASGSMMGFLASGVDITERMNAESACKESEVRFRSVFENAAFGIANVDVHGRIFDANHILEKMLGYTLDELKHMNVEDITHPEDWEKETIFANKMNKGEIESFEMEKRFIKKSGVEMWGHLTVSVTRGPSYEILFITGMVKDITDAKVAQQALKELEERLRTSASEIDLYSEPQIVSSEGDITRWHQAVETQKDKYNLMESALRNTHAKIAYLDSNLNILFVNQAFSESDDQEPSFYFGKEYFSIFPDTDAQEIFLNVLGTGEPHYAYGRPYHIDEQAEHDASHWDWSLIPVIAENDSVIGLVFTQVEVSVRLEIENELRNFENRFRAIFKNAGLAIAHVDVHGRIFDANHILEKMLGYTLDELKHMNVEDITHPEDWEKETIFANKMNKGEIESFEMEKRFIRKDEEICWVVLSVSSVRDSQGGIVYIIGTAYDITKKRLAERAFRYHAEILQSVSDAIISTDTDGKIQSWNKAAEEMFGWNTVDVIGRDVDNILNQDIAESSFDEVIQTLKDNDSWKGEAIVSTKNGSRLYVYTSISTLKDKDGKVIGAIAASRDITERKKMEMTLERSEAKYRALFENMPIAYAYHRLVLDDNLRPIDYEFLEVNDSFEVFTGLKGNEITGRRVTEVIPNMGEDEIDWIDIYGRVVLTDEPAIFEQYSQSLNRWYSAIAYSPIEGYFVVLFTDITDRKNYENALEESEKRFRDIAESTSDWIWEVDSEGVYTYAGERVADVLGYEPEELLGITPFDLMPHEEATRIKQIFLEIASRKERINDLENWNKHKYGHLVCLLTNGVPILENDGKLLGYRGLDKDITQRKKTELELRKLSHVIEQSPITVIITDTKGLIEYVNPEFSRLTGYSSDEVIGQNPRLLKSGLTPPEVYDDLWEHISSGQEWRGVFVNKKKNSDLYWEDARITPIRDNDGIITHFVAAKEDITERKKRENSLTESEQVYRTVVNAMEELVFVYDTDNRYKQIHASDESLLIAPIDSMMGRHVAEILPSQVAEPILDNLRALRDTGIPRTFDYSLDIKDQKHWFSASFSLHEDGKCVVAVVRDITEVRKTYDKLQLQKEELSEFAHAMGHDLNNFILKLRMHTKLLESGDEPGHGDTIRGLLTDMSDLLRHSISLADAGLVVEKRKAVDIDALVKDLAKQYVPDKVDIEFRAKTVDAISFVLDFDLDGAVVPADETKVRQIFSNILQNAVQHGQPSRIQIKFELAGEGLTILITNNGYPIPEEVRSKIFDHGFSSEESGVGFGLAIVKKLVEAHGWSISLRNTTETTFEIFIPRTEM